MLWTVHRRSWATLGTLSTERRQSVRNSSCDVTFVVLPWLLAFYHNVDVVIL